MLIKQISVFVENRPGRLFEITGVLRDAGVDIRALTIADTTDFGIMRCLVDRPDEAIAVLSENGFTASPTEVVAVQVPDVPGGLAHVLQIIDDAGINVEYLYSFVRTPNDNALILFRVDDTEKCQKLFAENGIVTLTDEQVYGGGCKAQ